MELLAISTAPLVLYLLVTGLVAVDAAVPALPSDVAVVSAGALAATGRLDVGWALTAVVVGSVAGDQLVYAISRNRLPRVLERSRLGRRLHRTAHRAHIRMGDLSSVSLALGRFVPFGRTGAAATAGLVGVPQRRYLLISCLGALAWAGWLVGLGYVTGQADGIPLALQVLLAATAATAVALVIGVGRRVLLRRSPAPRDPSPERTPVTSATANGGAAPAPLPASPPSARPPGPA